MKCKSKAAPNGRTATVAPRKQSGNGQIPVAHYRRMKHDEPFAKEMRIECDGLHAWNLPAFKAAAEAHKVDETELVAFVDMLRHDVAGWCLMIQGMGNTCRDIDWCIENGIGKIVFEKGRALVRAVLNIPMVADERKMPFIIELDRFMEGAGTIRYSDMRQLPNAGRLSTSGIIYTIDDGFKGLATLLSECQKRFPQCAPAAENVLIDIEEFVPSMIGAISIPRVCELRRTLVAHLRTLRIELSTCGCATPPASFIPPGAVSMSEARLSKLEDGVAGISGAIIDSEKRTGSLIHQRFDDLVPVKTGVDYLVTERINRKAANRAKGKASQQKAAPEYAEARKRAAADMEKAVRRVADDPDVKAGKHTAVMTACRRVCKEFAPLTSKRNAMGKYENYAPLTDWKGSAVQPETVAKNFRTWKKNKGRARKSSTK